MNTTTDDRTSLDQHLDYLKLPFFKDNYEPLAKKAAHSQWDHVHFLGELATGEANQRKDRATQLAQENQQNAGGKPVQAQLHKGKK